MIPDEAQQHMAKPLEKAKEPVVRALDEPSHSSMVVGEDKVFDFIDNVQFLPRVRDI
jgi:hypothetical protein